MPPLADLIRSNDVVWKDNRVVYKYRRIIHDIIELFAEVVLSDQYCHWDIRHINIVNNRVRKDSILNPDSGPIVRRTCKMQFISMVRDILGNGNNERELNHYFYHMANHGVAFMELWHHPLLMGRDERFFFPMHAFKKPQHVSKWETHELTDLYDFIVKERISMRFSAGGLAGPICCDSALAVEAHSAIKGLALSANLGFRDVIVETDSKLPINEINGDFRNKVWSIMPLLEELHRICGSMHEVRWSWVHRDLNRAAHEEAMIGVRAMELESWVSRPPLSLVQVLVSDGLPCPP